MTSITVSAEYGIVVRLASLQGKGIDLQKILTTMEAEEPLDRSEDMASFGPHFGREATDEIVKRLEKLGLIYIDGFFVFCGDFPDWCAFRAELS